jgi:hypothetical protein
MGSTQNPPRLSPVRQKLLIPLVFSLPHASILRTCQPELSTMDQRPIIWDFTPVKSSVPFPTANNSQTGTPPEHHRQRTGSKSSSSSSSGIGPYQIRAPTTSMSRRPHKQLSPVVEECEDSPSRRRFGSSQRVGSRVGHRPRPRATSYVGQTGLIAEDLTIAIMSVMPPSPPRHQTKGPIRQSSMSKTKSRFQNFRQSIRVRLPTIRSVRVWRRKS